MRLNFVIYNARSYYSASSPQPLTYRGMPVAGQVDMLIDWPVGQVPRAGEVVTLPDLNGDVRVSAVRWTPTEVHVVGEVY